MQSNEFYFAVTVFGAFAIFGLGLAVNYVQYRRWLKQTINRGQTKPIKPLCVRPNTIS
jgi:hypothetical protein